MRDDEIGVVHLPVEGHHRDHHARQSAQREDEQEAKHEQRCGRYLKASGCDRRDPCKNLNAGRHRDRHAGSREEAQRKRRDASGEHVMHPKAKREEAGRDQGDDDQTVTDERRAGHRGYDHRDHAGSRQEDDVDLRVAEEPEQMLPQQGVTALLRNEERPAEGALELEQQRCQDYGRKREHDHSGEDQHRPGEHRHTVERHAWRARTQHADDQLDRARDRGDFDETDAEQPEIRAKTGRILRACERRIHGPAAGRREIVEQRAEEYDSSDEVGPEREGAEARKRKVARAEHLRQQENAHRFDDRHGEQEHHHGAVHREDLIVGLRRQERIARHCELKAHQQRQDSREQEKQQRGGDVKVANDRVVDRGDDPPPLRQFPGGLELFQFVPWAAAACLGDLRGALVTARSSQAHEITDECRLLGR